MQAEALVPQPASDIKLVSLYSTIKMMHGPINKTCLCVNGNGEIEVRSVYIIICFP